MSDQPPRPARRILAIHRYFWPDSPPYAAMLRAITANWAADGHQVEVVSTQPSYKKNSLGQRVAAHEIVDGVQVTRVDLPSEHGRPLVKLLNMVRFSWVVVGHVKRSGPYDMIMVSTAPPVFLAWTVKRVAKKTGARLIYHCMDLHPEIGRISGEFRNPVLYGLLRRIDSATCRAADRVVVLSSDMERALLARPGCTGKIAVSVINNFNLPTFAPEETSTSDMFPLAMNKPSGKFRVLFAGNIGRFQGLDYVIDSMHELVGQPQIELVFLGEGRALAALKQRAGKLMGKSVHFFPHQPLQIARQVIATADIALVTLAKSIYRFAFPSKTMTYLAEGCPLLVSVEPESELAKFVSKTGSGVAVEPGDIQGMARVIRELATDSAEITRLAQNARREGVAEFSADTVLPRWSGLVDDCFFAGSRE